MHADTSLVESKVGQDVFDALSARLGAAAVSGPATGLFQTTEATRDGLGGLVTLVGRAAAATGETSATGLFLAMQGKADQAGVATLSAAVGRPAVDSTVATGLFLAMQGKADQAGVATLSAAVGKLATGGDAATGLFQQMVVKAQVTKLEDRVTSLERAPVHEPDTSLLEGKVEQGVFDALSTRVGGLVTSVGKAAVDSTAAATGLFLAVQGKADQTDVATLSAAVGKAAAPAGGAAATGLFEQMAVKATQVTQLEDRVTALERAPVHEADTSLGEGSVGQGAFDALSARVGAAAGSGPATGLFQQVDDTRGAVGNLVTLVGRAAAPAGGADATGLFQQLARKANQDDVTNLTGRVGALEEGSGSTPPTSGAPRGVVVLPVDVTSINSSATGVAMAWSACYPDGFTGPSGLALRDFIERDCTSRGAGWAHQRSTPLYPCFTDETNRTYRMGVCHSVGLGGVVNPTVEEEPVNTGEEVAVNQMVELADGVPDGPPLPQPCVAQGQSCAVSAECCARPQGNGVAFCGEGKNYVGKKCRAKRDGDEEPVYPEYAARGIRHEDILPAGRYCGDPLGYGWDRVSMETPAMVEVCKSKYTQVDGYEGRRIHGCDVTADRKCRESAEVISIE